MRGKSVDSAAPGNNVVRDFFAFCGEISMLHLYKVYRPTPSSPWPPRSNDDGGCACCLASESGSQEAVVKFDSEAAANTACLLNNALIDGVNIKVEPFPHHDSPQPSERSDHQPPTNDSFTSIFSGIASTSRAWAESISTKVKELDKQYGVSDTVVSGASTAWTESKKFVGDLDQKYHFKESVDSAVQTTKEHMASAASTFNQKFGGKAPSPSGGASPTSRSPRQSPRAASPTV